MGELNIKKYHFRYGETSLLVSCYGFLLLLGDCHFTEEKNEIK